MKSAWPADKSERRKTESLIPYARNSRLHSPDQVSQIAASIKEWGFTNPILIEPDGGIIAGHGRVMAAQKMGLDEVPCVIAEGWTEAQKKAYVIADNKLAINSEWNLDALKVELQDLGELGFDIALTGFGVDEMAGMFLDDEPEGEITEDEVPEPPVDPITKPGDLWILGRHRVLCGDSTKAEDVGRLMGGAKADCIVTDPPYGIGIDGQKESKCSNPKHNRKAHEFMGWDAKRPPASLFDSLVAMQVPSVIFGGNYFADILPASRGWIYWSKGQDGLTMSDGELAWTSLEKPLRCVTVNRAALQGSQHPTQKPVAVIVFAIEYAGEGCMAIYDPFLGSGTTLIAAEQLGRTCYGMEISAQYVDVVVTRWQNATGKTAVLEDKI